MAGLRRSVSCSTGRQHASPGGGAASPSRSCPQEQARLGSSPPFRRCLHRLPRRTYCLREVREKVRGQQRPPPRRLILQLVALGVQEVLHSLRVSCRGHPCLRSGKQPPRSRAGGGETRTCANAAGVRMLTSRICCSSARARSRSASTCFASSLSSSTCLCRDRRERCPPCGAARMPSGSCVRIVALVLASAASAQRASAPALSAHPSNGFCGEVPPASGRTA
jgi:hypothetical protein